MHKPRKNHVISRKKFRSFLETHPEHRNSKATLDEFYKPLEWVQWENFGDIRETFGTASLVGRFVVFNVGGNKFRVVVEVNYEKKRFLIRHVLTHSEYDQDKWKN